MRSISCGMHFIGLLEQNPEINQKALRVLLCWPPASWIRNFQRKDYRKLKFASEGHHLLLVGGEVRLKPSTNQTDYQLLYRRQLPSVWLAYKTPSDMADVCGIQYSGPTTGTRKFKTRTSPNRHTNRRESAQQIRNTTTSYDRHLIYRNHSVIPTYRRFFAAQSPFIFLNLQSNTTCCQRLRHNHLPTSLMAALLPGLLQACWKRTATIRNTVNSLRKPAIKILNSSASSGKKCKYICYRHRESSCNFNQSQVEALPVARSRAAGEGREAT